MIERTNAFKVGDKTFATLAEAQQHELAVVLYGLLTGARFTWGLAHGEGHCSNCGYPGRAMHYIGDDALVVRNYILQYHPDSLLTASERKPKPEYA